MNINIMETENFKKVIRKILTYHLRLALTGKTEGIDLLKIIDILGPDEVSKRVSYYLTLNPPEEFLKILAVTLYYTPEKQQEDFITFSKKILIGI